MPGKGCLGSVRRRPGLSQHQPPTWKTSGVGLHLPATHPCSGSVYVAARRWASFSRELHAVHGETPRRPHPTDSWTRSSARCFLICRPLGEKPLQGNQDAALFSVPDTRLCADMHAKGQGPGSAASLVQLPLGSVRVHGAVGIGAET